MTVLSVPHLVLQHPDPQFLGTHKLVEVAKIVMCSI